MIQNVTAILRTWQFLWHHPIASRDRTAALGRWLRWQIGARILNGQAVMPFVQNSRLLVRRGMTGATGNIYAGLHEFEEMAFALHLLRPNDLFVDVGANVGVYTILAAAVAGARCISIEPIPRAFADLLANVRLNELEHRVTALQVGAGAAPGECEFTTDLDTVNHVVADGDSTERSIKVKLTTLDEVLKHHDPTLLKVDVEGYETKAFEGAMEVLAKRSLLGLIVELNGSGNRYRFDEGDLVRKFEHFGFDAYAYSPFERKLMPVDGVKNRQSNNTLFLREPEFVRGRLQSALPVSILGIPV